MADLLTLVHVAQVETDLRQSGVVDPAKRSVYCDQCGVSVPVVDEFDDQVGYEEQARPVRVVVLDCDHDVVTPLRRWPGG